MPRIITRRDVLFAASAASIWGVFPHLAGGVIGTTPVRIANASGTLELTLDALMRQQGFLESLGLDAQVMRVADGTRILGGVVGGSVDASMMSGFGQVFPAIAHGAELKILGGCTRRPTLALFSAKPYVRALKDLEGRTVGTGSMGALVYQLTVLLLRKYGVNVSKVRFVSVGSSADIFRAVSAGTVDAGAGEAALIPEAADYRVHPLEHGDMTVELEQYTFNGAWASNGAIDSKRDTLVRTLAAYAKLYRFVQTPQARQAFIQVRRSLFPNAPAIDHEAQWRYIQTYRPFAVDLTLSPASLRYMQDVNVGFGVQASVLPFSEIADMSLATDALRLLALDPA
jgi:NitT/TauT family transport system substrate-binding protein